MEQKGLQIITMQTNKQLVWVYVEHPMCSIECAEAICEVIEKTNLYEVKTIGPGSWPKTLLNKTNLYKGECIVFPGGEGDLDQYDSYLYQHKKLIQHFVSSGKRYFGVCMGGYFAGEYCFQLLGNISTKQYITRINSCTKFDGPTTVNIKWLDKKSYSAYFYDGAAFVLNNSRIDIKPFGYYKNKDIAALTVSFGEGKVGVMGPHLEAFKWWFSTVPEMCDKWKDSIQHKLFIQMFNEVMI